MSTNIVFPDAKGMVSMHCPFCGNDRQEAAAKLPGKVTFMIDCPCGASYENRVEIRKAFRKSIAFKVLISRLEPPGFSETVSISNLSLGGCGFQASAQHGLQIGNIIQIRFKTDQVESPVIQKKAAVRFVNDRYIGCKFAHTAVGMDTDFAFYFRKL